ncbi:uncharacterized protein LOC122392411 [Amphibalanus amphitrite]|uniref:uncharacterized protein LOC122392411 n=1 Tax=Amphibalanus amphitrite TaxID=1232801 RepID=UPI001C914C36|nr:uncharacterized protein LOC122392411 [Amphibalanus amphitrite]
MPGLPSILLFVVATVASGEEGLVRTVPQSRESLQLSADEPIPSSLLTEYQRLWRRPEEASRPAAAPQGLFSPWWVGRPATLSSEKQARRSGGGAREANYLATRPRRTEHQGEIDSENQGETDFFVFVCGSELTDLIENACHFRRRRDGRAVANAILTRLRHAGERIVDACCRRSCRLSELRAFITSTCEVSLDDLHRHAARFRISTSNPEQPEAPVTERTVVVTAGTPPVHLPVFEDPGPLIDGFQKRASYPDALAWEKDRDMTSFLVV